MGYACPVCDVPQRDAEHLANHLAFTAMLHGDDHETWLDEHVDDWASTNAETLGPRVASFAEEAEYDEVFEDTVHDDAGHGRGGSLFESRGEAGGSAPVDPGAAAERGGGDLDAETQEVLREARELTREMYSESGGREADDGDADADAEDADAEDADDT
jgi:hypothetical protein